MHARQAAVFKAVEATGLTRSDIARIAGIHRSQVSRWISGEQRPSYERTMRVAAHLRREDRGELAEQLITATGYGVPAEPVPELDDDPETLEVLRSAYRDDPGKVREVAKRLLEEEVRASSGQAGETEGSLSGRRAG